MRKQEMHEAPSHENWMDDPQVLGVVFHPRAEPPGVKASGFEEIAIPVETNVVVAARFYEAGKEDPTILFFHGNGEIVADYGDIAQLYRKLKINFMPVDYRGYGKSTGAPTVKSMLGDARKICSHARDWLAGRGYAGPLIVMGRSLGSASALEIAASCPKLIDGLIIESGFAYAVPLVLRLGAEIEPGSGAEMEKALDQLGKIRGYTGPALVMHGDQDVIIPFSDAEALHGASGSAQKKLVKLAGAGHNTVFSVGLKPYMQAVARFAASAPLARNQRSP